MADKLVRPLNLGHRGARALAPENTLAGMAAGMAAGADGVEFDVQRKRDGHLVVFHDDDMKRICGVGGRVVTTSAFYSSRVIREAGALAEDILFPLPPFDRTSDKEPVLGFVNHYMDTYERAPDVFAAHGYDAMRYAIEVMRLATPPQLQEIRRAMQFGVTEFMGVTGPILFDDYGDVKHYPKMFIVKDGQVLSYQRYLKTERARILREVQNLLINQN